MNFNYKTLSKKKAFTLIELLIVIAIIGILFIVLVSKVDFATDKAKASGVQTDFRSFQVALEMVSKENAGFNTFGWDTGDNAGAAPSGYTYTNASKDAGDRIRNSYDEGDTNLNGQYDDGEVWTGRKVYTETWTGCYTLINPGDASDMSAIFDLETAINKNLDPKLHIVIADDGTISMANGYKDPWSTQYHGQYITNASADAAAKWNTDASMAGSTGDNMDRGAIVMYSNGANQKFGTKVKIVGGVVTATVSQIDADHPDNNQMGADDYVLAVVYTYTNGYGETAVITEGFSNNQQFLTGNGGNVGNVVDGENMQDTYDFIYGANLSYNRENITPLSFIIESDINNFKDVVVDTNTLQEGVDYTVTDGTSIIHFDASDTDYIVQKRSVIITLEMTCRANISNGMHEISFIFEDNTVTTSLNMTGNACNHINSDCEWSNNGSSFGHVFTYLCYDCDELFDFGYEAHTYTFSFYEGDTSNGTHMCRYSCGGCTDDWSLPEDCVFESNDTRSLNNGYHTDMSCDCGNLSTEHSIRCDFSPESGMCIDCGFTCNHNLDDNSYCSTCDHYNCYYEEYEHISSHKNGICDICNEYICEGMNHTFVGQFCKFCNFSRCDDWLCEYDVSGYCIYCGCYLCQSHD